jgi:hypothetical protein
MKQQGYMIVDHSASPGFTEEQARAVGYDPKMCGEGKVFETKTFTCMDCKTSVVPNVFRVRPRESCRRCLHYVCDICAFRASFNDYVCGCHRRDAVFSDNQAKRLLLKGGGL